MILFKKVDAYHAASTCGRYTIARFNAGTEATYMAFKGSAFIGAHTFAIERDDDGVELGSYPARVDAFKAALSVCENDAQAVKNG